MAIKTFLRPLYRGLHFIACALAVSSVAVSSALAQADYPQRPVTIVVGASPGSGNDVAARLVADYLSKQLGQPFIVENRPGASGARASEYVVTKPADGYTLLLGNSATQIYNKMLVMDSTFDPDRDTVLAGMFGQSTNLLIVNPKLNINTVAELVALAKSKPGGLNYGSAGNGGSIHLATAYFNKQAGIDVVHVPFKSGAEMGVDIVAGTTDFSVDNLSNNYASVTSGALKALAVTSDKRWPSLPDVPTMAEAGFKDFTVLSIYGLVAKTGTNEAILQKIDAAIAKFVADPAEATEKLARIGTIPFPLPRAQYASFIASQSGVWKAMIDTAGIPRK